MTDPTAPSAPQLQSEYDVVIVGFGPAGVVAACCLGQTGVRTLAIDKSTTIWQIPRAVAIDHEILRILQNLGVADKVLPFTAPFPASQHFGAEGQLIRRIDAVQPPYPLGYTPTMVFTQPAVEAVLREHVATFPSVTVRLGLELTALQQDSQHSSLQLQTEDDRSHCVRARYVIGCDGASSTVRRLTGLKLHDLGFDEPWLVVDVNVKESSLGSLPETAAQYCTPERPTTFIIGPGNHRRWEIMLSPGEDPREMEKDENVWRLLAPWLTPQDGTLWRASSYRFHALVAEQWRSGRVFLAGDAAHQQPPFIGQGMCQGIRDVVNLCWKLTAVLHGEAGDALLDTYAQERGRHVHTLTARIKVIGHHICERDPEAARLRDETLILQGGGQAPTVTRQEIVPPLETGLLAETPHPANGTLFPQPWIATAAGPTHMDDLTGHGWRLIVDGRRLQQLNLSRPDSEALPMQLVVVGGEGLAEQDGILEQWFDRQQCKIAIVRPDHYVYGVANSADDTRKLIDSLRKRLMAEGSTPPQNS